jgi:hypothetical protein
VFLAILCIQKKTEESSSQYSCISPCNTIGFYSEDATASDSYNSVISSYPKEESLKFCVTGTFDGI